MDMASELVNTAGPKLMGEETDWLTAFDSIHPDQVAPLFESVPRACLEPDETAHYGLVYMVDRKEGVLRLAAERGMGVASREANRERFYAGDAPPQGVVALVARDGVTRRTTGDEAVDPSVWKSYKPFLDSDHQVRSFLCVPIKLGEHVLGVLDLEDRSPAKFSYLDAVVIQSFANMAATALANAGLMVARRERQELETSLARLLGRLDLFSMVAHDIKGPLALQDAAFSTIREYLKRGRYEEAVRKVDEYQQRFAGRQGRD